MATLDASPQLRNILVLVSLANTNPIYVLNFSRTTWPAIDWSATEIHDYVASARSTSQATLGACVHVYAGAHRCAQVVCVNCTITRELRAEVLDVSATPTSLDTQISPANNDEYQLKYLKLSSRPACFETSARDRTM